MAESDAESLVARARRGDPRARAELARAHYDGVYSLARKLTRDEDAAREVAQETFARAFGHLDQHDDEHPFASWLFKIATNYIRDLARRRGRWESSDEEPVVASTPETILQKTEDVARVRRALDTLPAETRAAMILHLQEEMPIRDISFVLDLSENAVRMKIYRGLQKVRALVKEES
ncbi:MAG: sigma-70 family RNA polymerase sigma factor [Planctomycetes bacterium]|nr:sigma-70 family RNA polymerase sigma factor [Planctomycetota bacterium]